MGDEDDGDFEERNGNRPAYREAYCVGPGWGCSGCGHVEWRARKAGEGVVVHMQRFE